MSVNQISDISELLIVCDFLFYGYPSSKKKNMVLQGLESYENRPTNDRHISLYIP